MATSRTYSGSFSCCSNTELTRESDRLFKSIQLAPEASAEWARGHGNATIGTLVDGFGTRVVPVDNHLSDKDSVQSAGQRKTPPHQTVAGFLAGCEQPGEAAKEGVEDGKGGEVSR